MLKKHWKIALKYETKIEKFVCKNDIKNGFDLAKKSEDFVVNGVLKGA